MSKSAQQFTAGQFDLFREVTAPTNPMQSVFPGKHTGIASVTLDLQMKELLRDLNLVIQELHRDFVTSLSVLKLQPQRIEELVRGANETFSYHGRFKIPSPKVISELRESISDLCRENPKDLANRSALSAICAVNEACHLYNVTGSEGRVAAFSHLVRRKIQILLTPNEDIEKYLKLAYADDRGAGVVAKLVDGSAFEEFFRDPRPFLNANANDLKRRGGVKRFLLKKYQELIDNPTFINHTKDQKIVSTCIDHLAENPQGKIVVFNYLKDLAIYRAMLLNQKLRPHHEAEFLTGDTTKGNFDSILEAFYADSSLSICSCTSVLEYRGAALKNASLVIVVVPTSEAERIIKQRAPGSLSAPGNILYLLGNNTADNVVYTAGQTNLAGLEQNLKSSSVKR